MTRHTFRPAQIALLLSIGISLTAVAVVPAAAADETSFKVSGTWLSQTARRGDLDYAIPDNGSSIGSVERVEPESDSGYRFRFDVMRGKANFFVAYTSFDSDTTAEVVDPGDNLTGTLVIDDYTEVGDEDVARAGARWDVDYSIIDLGAGYDLRQDSPLGLRLVGGVRTASVEENMSVFYSDNLAVTAGFDAARQGTEMDAIGIFVGLEPRFEFNSLVSVYGGFTYSALMADADQTFVYTTSTNGGQTLNLDVDLDTSQDVTVNIIELGFGVEFTVSDHFSITGGYEIQTWQNYPGFLKHTNESGEVTFDHSVSDIGFDGAFVRAAVSF